LKQEAQKVVESLALSVAQISAELTKHQERKAVIEAEIANADLQNRSKLAMSKEIADQKLAEDKANLELQLRETESQTVATVQRFEAAQKGFAEALIALGNQDTLVKVAQAVSVQNIIGGKNVVETVEKMFAGTPFGKMLGNVASKAGLTPDTIIPSATR